MLPRCALAKASLPLAGMEAETPMAGFKTDDEFFCIAASDNMCRPEVVDLMKSSDRPSHACAEGSPPSPTGYAAPTCFRLGVLDCPPPPQPPPPPPPVSILFRCQFL